MANGKTATNLQDQSFPPSQAPTQTLLSEAMIEEQSVRLIIDRIPGQIAVMTAAGEVELVNRQILEYFGKTTEELQNWATNNSFHPDDIRIDAKCPGRDSEIWTTERFLGWLKIANALI